MRSLHIALLLTCSLLLFGIKASPAQANPLLTWDVYPETYPSGACPSPTPLPYQFTSEGIFVDVRFKSVYCDDCL
jgi:hypothetical protein